MINKKNFKVYLLSFTTTYKDLGFENLEARQIRLVNSAHKFGIQNIISWNRQKLIKTKFYEQHKKILDQRIGAGFWLWKPYIILDTLKKINDGDIVIYCDTSMFFVADPQPLIKVCLENDGFFLIAADKNYHISHIAKRDVFELLKFNTEKYYYAPATQAYIQIYQKNEKTLEFVQEWLNICQDEQIITDSENICGLPNFPDFRSHKGDMPILSLLRIKYNIEGFRNPSQWGNHSKLPEWRIEGELLATANYSEEIFTNSKYPTIFQWNKGNQNIHIPLHFYFSLDRLRVKLGKITKRLFTIPKHI
jgi:hypothetical protein